MSTAVSMQAATRRIAVQPDVPSILRAAVHGAHDLLGTDTAFAAAAQPARDAYAMCATSGTRSPALGDLVVAPMVGLGGRVGVLRRPMAVHDYLTDGSITRDFVDVVVHQEGLRGVACVPVLATVGVAGLLYVGIRQPGFLADRTLDSLAELGAYAGVAIDQAMGQARRHEITALRERQRLATSLHDSVAQTLFTIGVEAKRSRHETDPARLAATLDEIASYAALASQELRDTLRRVNDIPARMSLAVALDAEARAFERLGDLTVRVVAHGDARPLPEIHESLICDTVREGVRNAVKHGGAELVVVHVRYGSSDVAVTVQSDRPAASPPRPRGGLALLRGRASALRGALEVMIGEEGEVIIRLTLPDYQTDLEEGSR